MYITVVSVAVMQVQTARYAIVLNVTMSRWLTSAAEIIWLQFPSHTEPAFATKCTIAHLQSVYA